MEALLNKNNPPNIEIIIGPQADMKGIRIPFTPNELNKKEIT